MPPARREGLVGREAEFGRVLAVLGACADGETRVVLEGEAGIGKTALWQAGLDEARRRRLCTLEARPVAAEQGLAFAALGDLLTDVTDEIGGLPAPQRRALRVALLLDDARGRPPEPRTIAVALTALLGLLSSEGPALVAIDDAHWLDPPSAAALGFALRRLDERSVRLLATARTGTDARSPITEAERVIVGPLELDPLAALLRARLDRPFRRPIVRRLQEASGGNPFYALELATVLLQSGRDLEPGELPALPSDLRDVISMRFSSLSRGAREAVLATATLARPTASMVERATRRRRASVEEAVAAGMIVTSGESLRFTHPLFATGVVEVSSSAERRRIHRRLADLVTEPEERARHLAEAAEGADEAIAAAVEAAAASVAGRGAPDAAANLGKLAVELTPRDRHSELHRRSLDYARYTVAAGDPRKAARLLEQQLSVTAGRRERAEIGLQLALAVRAVHGATAAIRHCEDALREADGGLALDLQAQILTELADMHFAEMRTDSDVSQRALELAEKGSDQGLLARALGVHGLTLADRGLPPPAEYWERARQIERASGPLRSHGPAHAYATVLSMRDDMAGAEACLREVVDSMRRNEDIALPNVLLHLSDLARTLGHWDDAIAYVEEAHEVIRQTGRDSLEPRCLLCLARFAMLRGEPQRARSLIGAALAVLDELRSREENEALRAGPVLEEGLANVLLARIALLSKRYSEAHELLMSEIETLRTIEAGEMLVEVLAEDIAVLIALRELEGAAAEAAEMEAILLGRRMPSLDALAARSRGLIAAEGDAATALEHLERSRDLLDEASSPWPFELARTLLSLGSVQLRARQRRAARASLERALTIFEELGAPVWAESARAELSRIGGRASRSGELTETERRVAETVAAGHSNAEAAHALFMSPKTVEWNLSKIYKKLHVRSRAELAAKLVNQLPQS